MAVKLVRESSTTPNITNKDDVRMIRYAYGGHTGAVKGYGKELQGITSGSVFTVQDGRFVFQGWEIDIYDDGWALDVSNLNSGTLYHTVYIEINALAETAQIKSFYDTAAYPDAPAGDDLTQYPNGTANTPLFHVMSVNGSVNSVEALFQVIPYEKDELEEVRERLDALGFKQGAAVVSGKVEEVRSNSLIKQGKHVVFSADIKVTWGGDFSMTIPLEFRPAEPVLIAFIQSDEEILSTGGFEDTPWVGALPGAVATITPAGEFTTEKYAFFGDRVYIPSVGWKLP